MEKHDMFHRQHHRGGFFGFGPQRRWEDGGEPPFDWIFGRAGGRGGRGWGGRWGGGGQRFPRRGDLKYVVLELLNEQPRHGYDIIRALEDRFRGFYRPSPGSVYPTLQMLEDLGYVTATQQEGKKVYSITDEGRRHLNEQESTVEDIRSRVRGGWDAASRPELADLMHELRQLARALFQQGTRGALHDPDRLKLLRTIVERARREVETLNETRVV
jgi:DNA-binding PadR family transcriptional regulator